MAKPDGRYREPGGQSGALLNEAAASGPDRAREAQVEAALTRAILDQSADAIVICDPAGRVVRASRAAHALGGANLIGKRFAVAFPLRRPDGCRFPPLSAMDADRSQTVEAKLADNGRVSDLLVHVGHLTGAGGELFGRIVTLTDVTERSRSAAEALQVAARLTATLESITDAFMTVDRDWRFTFLNREAERLLSRTREQLIGRDMWQEFAPAIGSIFEREYRGAVTENHSTEFEAFYPPLDTWFGVRAYPSEQGLAVYFRDIGERKRAEQVMLERLQLQNQLVHLAESVPGLIYSFELRPDGSIRMPYASGALTDLFDLQPSDVINDARPALSLIHPDDIAGVSAAIGESARTLTHWNSEFRIRRTRKGEIWVEGSAVPEAGPDGSVLWQGFLQNITERKRAADRLRESKDLLRLVLEHAPARIFWKDRDLRYLGANILFANDAGRTSPAELVGKSDLDMPWKDQAESYRSADRAVLASGDASLNIEEPQTTPDGDTIWLCTSKVPLRDKDGQIIGILGLYQDITAGKKIAQQLHESERRFSDLLGSVELVSVMLDSAGRITYCNGYLLRLTGWLNEDVIGRSWIEIFVPPEDAAGTQEALDSVLRNNPETWHRENEILTRSGERRLIRWNNSVLRSGTGDVTGSASIGEDITDQRQAELRVRRLNRTYSMLSGINSLIVRVSGRDELFREACRIAVESGGFSMSLICIADETGTTVVPVASGGKSEGLVTAITKALSSPAEAAKTMVVKAIREKTAVVANNSRDDARLVFVTDYAAFGVRSVAVMPLVVADRALGVFALYATEPDFFDEEEMTLLLELASDIAFAMDHIDQEARLDFLAHYDPMTGLANRGMFLERAAQYQRGAAGSGDHLAVLAIDLDRFRNINESLGRGAGDALLVQVAEWLTRYQGDASMVARTDADHFAIVLPAVKKESNLVPLVEALLKALADCPFRLNDAVFRVSAKLGVALFPSDGADVETLLRHAEAAVKKAKATGERYLFHTTTITSAMTSTLSMENQLHQALMKGEFVLHYQPKVNLASGLVTGVEALIRWQDPLTGLVEPAQFIPILEDTGMIHDVGRWALRKAVEDYLRWRAAGLPAVRIAVNVSALQLRHSGFINEIRQAIAIDAHAAEGLELEITESVIMADVRLSIESLKAIRAMGVTIAIDDFGTGFSSLKYLATLPVDALKIDRSFVVDMTTGPHGLALVSTIVSLAHALKLKVVAEGVETEEQSRLLRLLGCEETQGFLFSEPVPADVFEAQFLARPT